MKFVLGTNMAHNPHYEGLLVEKAGRTMLYSPYSDDLENAEGIIFGKFWESRSGKNRAYSVELDPTKYDKYLLLGGIDSPTDIGDGLTVAMDPWDPSYVIIVKKYGEGECYYVYRKWAGSVFPILQDLWSADEIDFPTTETLLPLEYYDTDLRCHKIKLEVVGVSRSLAIRAAGLNDPERSPRFLRVNESSKILGVYVSQILDAEEADPILKMWYGIYPLKGGKYVKLELREGSDYISIINVGHDVNWLLPEDVKADNITFPGVGEGWVITTYFPTEVQLVGTLGGHWLRELRPIAEWNCCRDKILEDFYDNVYRYVMESKDKEGSL